MSKFWIKLKRILIVITVVITVLLGISGVIGMVIFQKPDMKTVYGYLGLGILDISLIIVGLFLARIGLYGSERDVS